MAAITPLNFPDRVEPVLSPEEAARIAAAGANAVISAAIINGLRNKTTELVTASNSSLKGLSISGSTLTATKNDGSTATVTLPTGPGGVGSAVKASKFFLNAYGESTWNPPMDFTTLQYGGKALDGLGISFTNGVVTIAETGLYALSGVITGYRSAAFLLRVLLNTTDDNNPTLEASGAFTDTGYSAAPIPFYPLQLNAGDTLQLRFYVNKSNVEINTQRGRTWLALTKLS